MFSGDRLWYYGSRPNSMIIDFLQKCLQFIPKKWIGFWEFFQHPLINIDH